MIQKEIILFLLILVFSGCSISPTVEMVLIDRHTVMESEAAGEWPQVQKRLQLNKGPLALSDVNDSKREEKAFRVLNGEFSQ